MSEARNKIILAEGTEDEKTITLKRPKGRKSREMMPKVLNFMTELAKKQSMTSDDISTNEVASLVSQFWSKSEFEEELVPFVLQMDDAKGKKWLEENGTLGDILNGFTNAAQYLIEESFQRQEVQEAMGKSEEEAQEAHKKK